MYKLKLGSGKVTKNIKLRDRETGYLRQIDVWIESDIKGHKIYTLIDSKLRRVKIDVKDVEDVLSLAKAVGANKSVIVTPTSWTPAAYAKAVANNLELIILSKEEALSIISKNDSVSCPISHQTKIVVQMSIGVDIGETISIVNVGKCLGCESLAVNCWDCGENFVLQLGQEHAYACNHRWRATASELMLKVTGYKEWLVITDDIAWLEVNRNGDLIRKGISFVEAGEIEKAIISFTEAIAISKSSLSRAKAYFYRGSLFDKKNLLEKAIDDYSKAIKDSPDLSIVYVYRGIAYYNNGEYESSLRDLRYFLVVEPHSTDVKTVEQFIQACLEQRNKT